MPRLHAGLLVREGLLCRLFESSGIIRISWCMQKVEQFQQARTDAVFSPLSATVLNSCCMLGSPGCGR